SLCLLWYQRSDQRANRGPRFLCAFCAAGPDDYQHLSRNNALDVRSGAIDSRVPADARPYRSRAATSHGHRHMCNQRARCSDDAANSFYSQLAIHAQRVVDRTVTVGLSRSWFGSAAPDECRAETRESLVSIPSPKHDGYAISFFLLCPSSHV